MSTDHPAWRISLAEFESRYSQGKIAILSHKSERATSGLPGNGQHLHRKDRYQSLSAYIPGYLRFSFFHLPSALRFAFTTVSIFSAASPRAHPESDRSGDAAL